MEHVPEKRCELANISVSEASDQQFGPGGLFPRNFRTLTDEADDPEVHIHQWFIGEVPVATTPIDPGGVSPSSPQSRKGEGRGRNVHTKVWLGQFELRVLRRGRTSRAEAGVASPDALKRCGLLDWRKVFSWTQENEEFLGTLWRDHAHKAIWEAFRVCWPSDRHHTGAQLGWFCAKATKIGEIAKEVEMYRAPLGHKLARCTNTFAGALTRVAESGVACTSGLVQFTAGSGSPREVRRPGHL